MEARDRRTGDESRATGLGLAESHLSLALGVIGDLLEVESAVPAGQAIYHLGEASRAIHHALIALAETVEVTTSSQV